jgi:RNA polymerase sigma-70 factor (ECF subfamily)
MAAEDDERRLRALFDSEARAVLGYALRRARHADDAADVVAETFAVAWRRIGDVPAGAGARPWLLGVARRVLANQRRGRRRRARLDERLRHELRAALPAARPADEVADSVRRALATLGEQDREVLLLAGWEGLEPAEIAAVCGIPQATARTRLHRARGRLRAALEADGWRPAARPAPTPVRLEAEKPC